MTVPLSAETLARMRAAHVRYDGLMYSDCLTCASGVWPCDMALLLVELDRREVEHYWKGCSPLPNLALVAGHDAALFGPRTAEDLC